MIPRLISSLALAGMLVGLRPPPAAAELQPPPVASEELDPAARPGRFRLGPIYLTPRFRLGNIGLDTNVYYTPEDRQTDISASGGPALEVVLPIRQSTRLVTEGGVNYLYFVRTNSQRQLVGDVRSGLFIKGVRTELSLGGGYLETFVRPALEVDRRVAEVETFARGELRRRLAGRTRLVLGGSFSHLLADPGQEFLGVDLRQTLSRDLTSFEGGLDYTLTAKTRLELLASFDDYRYLFDASRDGRHTLATFGIRTDSGPLISGHAKVGAERHESRTLPGPAPVIVHGEVNALWHLSPRFALGGLYRHDLYQTAFITPGGPPVGRRTTAGANLQAEFVRNVLLWLAGTRMAFQTESPVQFETGSGRVVEGVRREKVYEARAELTYRFRPRLRAGGTATYSERVTTFEDFGVDGLLVGATIIFTP